VGTKQLRISHPQQINSRMPEFLGKQINVVLHNGNVFPGRLQAVTATGITLLNMRLKEIAINIKMINELYFDTEA